MNVLFVPLTLVAAVLALLNAVGVLAGLLDAN